MNKISFLLVLAALVIGGTILAPKIALAYRGDPNVQGPNYTPERHEAMVKAFENNDYNAWKTQMAGRGRASEVINASNFSKFAQAHKLMLEGKIDEANKIKTELGLGTHNGSGMGQGMGLGRNR